MKKPREFWIKDHGGPTFDVEVLYTPISNSIHVREVVPIDWEKIKNEFDDHLFDNGDRAVFNSSWDKVKELVEKQLRGEE